MKKPPDMDAASTSGGFINCRTPAQGLAHEAPRLEHSGMFRGHIPVWRLSAPKPLVQAQTLDAAADNIA
ncbi:hypothetical protein PUR_03790 [Paenibacillus sp. URB8-2]|nr:hypothetical protein PUR_03790 [Paenibacillus sp. URB8-2]